jgi:tripartite-type tricarboxylate transporter receptor subunit TctC
MPNHRLTRRGVLGAAFAPWLVPAATHAQSTHAGAAAFPERPLRLVVPLPAGSITDVQARPIAQKLGDALGQPVVVENRPGATGTIGVDAVAKALPDGYTLVLATLAPLVILPHLIKLPFDPMRDLAPITRVTAGPIVLVAHPGAPFDNVRQLVEHSRARPGDVKVATFGVGSFAHLTTLMIEAATGAHLTPVPYQGGPQPVADTIGGQVQLLLDFPPVIGPYVREGKLKALAVTGARRYTTMPDVPTFEELGYKGVQATAWQGIMAPAATPAPVLRRLSQELMKVLAAPDLREMLGRGGAEVGGDTPEAFAAFIRDEYERWGRLIRDKGVRLG